MKNQHVKHDYQADGQLLDEIEREIMRDDRSLAISFSQLDGFDNRRDVRVFSLLAASMLLLAIGLLLLPEAALVAGAFVLAGAVAFVASLKGLLDCLASE